MCTDILCCSSSHIIHEYQSFPFFVIARSNTNSMLTEIGVAKILAMDILEFISVVSMLIVTMKVLRN